MQIRHFPNPIPVLHSPVDFLLTKQLPMQHIASPCGHPTVPIPSPLQSIISEARVRRIIAWVTHRHKCKNTGKTISSLLSKNWHFMKQAAQCPRKFGPTKEMSCIKLSTVWWWDRMQALTCERRSTPPRDAHFQFHSITAAVHYLVNSPRFWKLLDQNHAKISSRRYKKKFPNTQATFWNRMLSR